MTVVRHDRVMTPGSTDLYDGADVPPLVAGALALARQLGFDDSCRPEQGRLLAALAAGRRAGRIGETGTGCGVGLAWLVTGCGERTGVVSVEHDAERARAVRELFAGVPQVRVVHGDWTALTAFGPFDLLVLDGGGTGKDGGSAADPERMLVPGGTVVIDDFTAAESWPPQHEGALDVARLSWLEHPALLATEVLVGDGCSSIIATRRPPRSH